MPSAIKPRVLYVEDDVSSAQLLALYLRDNGFEVFHYDNADDAVRALDNLEFDVAIFDIMIRNGDGRDLLKIAVAQRLPSLMVTAKVDEADRLDGFSRGADDYVCKPYSLKEVVARVKALMSRSKRGHQLKQLRYHNLTIDLDAQRIFVCAEDVALTSVEFNLLATLGATPTKVFTRANLIDLVWNGEPVTDRAVDTHMANLRKKLAAQDPDQNYVITRYGQGYQFNTSTEKL